jgi:hypothetical protein
MLPPWTEREGLNKKLVDRGNVRLIRVSLTFS